MAADFGTEVVESFNSKSGSIDSVNTSSEYSENISRFNSKSGSIDSYSEISSANQLR